MRGETQVDVITKSVATSLEHEPITSISSPYFRCLPLTTYNCLWRESVQSHVWSRRGGWAES